MSLHFRTLKVAALPTLLLAFLALTAPRGWTQTAHLAATPPMGWNSWNHFATKVTAADVRAAADAMVSSGMKAAGYTYINIDDSWEGHRDAQGNIHPDSRFPNMKALAGYVHSKGLKLGIYSSPGPKTCGGYEGSYGHVQQDADTYAKWGIDYLKYDLCSYESIANLWDLKHPNQPIPPAQNQKGVAMIEQAYARMHQALVNTHRPIVFSICEYGIGEVWKWGPKAGGNLWRTTDDISDNYRSMSLIGFSQDGLGKYAGPSHWNDPDMLEIGNSGMTPDEERTQMSLWSILAAPLIAGNDLAHMDATTKSILLNREVIAVDQDSLGIEGHRLSPLQIWVKPLVGGAKAVAIFNVILDDQALPITLHLKDIGFTGPVHARNLWAHKDLGILRGSYTVVPPPGGVVMLRLWQ